MHGEFENPQPLPPPNLKLIEPPEFRYCDRVRTNPRTRIGFLVAALDFREWHGFIPFSSKIMVEEFTVKWLQVDAGCGELISLAEELQTSAKEVAASVESWSSLDDLESEALELSCKLWEMEKERGDGEAEGEGKEPRSSGSSSSSVLETNKRKLIPVKVLADIFFEVWDEEISTIQGTARIMEYIKRDPVLELLDRFPLSMSKVTEVLHSLGCDRRVVSQCIEFLSWSPLRRDVCAFRVIAGCPRPEYKVLQILEDMLIDLDTGAYTELKAYTEQLARANSCLEEHW